MNSSHLWPSYCSASATVTAAGWIFTESHSQSLNIMEDSHEEDSHVEDSHKVSGCYFHTCNLLITQSQSLNIMEDSQEVSGCYCHTCNLLITQSQSLNTSVSGVRLWALSFVSTFLSNIDVFNSVLLCADGRCWWTGCGRVWCCR